MAVLSGRPPATLGEAVDDNFGVRARQRQFDLPASDVDNEYQHTRRYPQVSRAEPIAAFPQ